MGQNVSKTNLKIEPTSPIKAKIPFFHVNEVRSKLFIYLLKKGGQAQSPNFSQIVNGTQVHY